MQLYTVSTNIILRRFTAVIPVTDIKIYQEQYIMIITEYNYLEVILNK